jgi:glycolate oxidase iron-sulfur subunit
MKKLKELPELALVRHEAEKCVGCGNCLYYCPVYAETEDENYVARGRNRLLKETMEDPKELLAGLRDRFDKCLLCGRCTMVCPHGVRNDLLIMAARAEIVRSQGLPWSKSVAFRRILKDRKTMMSALRTASMFQSLLPVTPQQGPMKHMPKEKQGLIRHLPLFLAGLGGGRQLPAIARRFLSEELPEMNPASEKSIKRNLRVAYFSGCATEFVLPETGQALVRLLNDLGVEVVFPKAQGCCGLAVYANGDDDTALALAEHNLEVLEGCSADVIVTGCATCGSALKEGWSRLARNDDSRRRFDNLAAKVKDISELVVDLADFEPLRFRSILPPGTKVTYHDPCHLARHQKVTEEPRQILRQVFGENFIDMDNKGCCGCGGTFNVYNYDLSKKIAVDKVESIARTQADVVINTCPGCMMQLIDNIERHGLPQRVIHLVEAVEPMTADEERP